MVYGGHNGAGVTLGFKNNRDLAMLQLVMTKRFGLGEGFWFESNGSTIWLHPSIPVVLNYDQGEPIEVSKESVYTMNDAARSAFGVSLGPESVAGRITYVDPEWTPESADNES